MTTENETHQQPNQEIKRTHKVLKEDIKNSCNAIDTLLNKISKGDTVSDSEIASTGDIISQVQAELAVRNRDQDRNKDKNKNKYKAFFSLANTNATLVKELNKIKKKHDDLSQQTNKLKNLSSSNLEKITFYFSQENMFDSSNTQGFIKKIEEMISDLENNNPSDKKSVKKLDEILKNVNKIKLLGQINSNLQPAIKLYTTYMNSVKTDGPAEQTSLAEPKPEKIAQDMIAPKENTLSTPPPARILVLPITSPITAVNAWDD